MGRFLAQIEGNFLERLRIIIHEPLVILRSKALDAHSKLSDVYSKPLNGHPKPLNTIFITILHKDNHYFTQKVIYL